MATQPEWPIIAASPPLSTLAASTTCSDSRDWLMKFIHDAPEAAIRDVGAIAASPAGEAFLRMRVEQLVKSGHRPDSDLALPLAELPRKAENYLRDAIDLVMSDDGAAFAGRNDHRKIARRKIAVAGALLLAAWDSLTAAIERADGVAQSGTLGDPA